jgi:hypothetical protein
MLFFRLGLELIDILHYYVYYWVLSSQSHMYLSFGFTNFSVLLGFLRTGMSQSRVFLSFLCILFGL